MGETRFEPANINGVPIVAVHGEVDTLNAAEFAATLKAACGSWDSMVAVDLTACRYMDSSGLAVLIKMHKTWHCAYPVIVPKDGFIRRIFNITGVDTMLILLEDKSELRALKAEPPAAPEEQPELRPSSRR